MTRFNDVCGTSYVPNVITVTEGPEEWQWTAQGKTLYCTGLGSETKSCTSVTNSLESYFAPATGTNEGFLPGRVEQSLEWIAPEKPPGTEIRTCLIPIRTRCVCCTKSDASWTRKASHGPLSARWPWHIMVGCRR